MSIYKGDKLIAGSDYQAVCQTKTGSFPATSKTGILNSNCVLTEGTWLVFVGLLFHKNHIQGDVALTIGNVEAMSHVRCRTAGDEEFSSATLVDIVTIAEGESKAVGINIVNSSKVFLNGDEQYWYVKAVRVA